MVRTTSRSGATARAIALLLVALACGVLTWRLRPGPVADRDPVGEIVRGCGWAAWLVACWLVASVAIRAVGHLAHHSPRAKSRPSRLDRVVPGRLGRVIDLVIAVGLLGAILGGTALPASAAPVVASVGTPAPAAPTGAPLQWPGLPERNTVPPPSPQRAHPRPSASVHLVSGAPRRAAGSEEVVTVHTGDSLWSIAATHLGTSATTAQIAASWPRWYAVNRAVIGADPSVIRPGQQLRPPPHRPAGSSP